MLRRGMRVIDTTRPGKANLGERPGQARSATWRVACGLMALAGVGLVAAVFLGAPLVSILLAGLLLLCPLLMWAPLRYQRRSLGSLLLGRRAR